MSRATALVEAQKLKAVMARHGVQCSIELQVGRPWSGGDDWYVRKHAIMNHHTAGSMRGLTPSLALCKRGRGTDLPGPLCNGYGGRDLIYRVLCMGLANHPGAGGPLTLAGFTIPRDSARPSVWGTEWEHDGVSEWPAEMREFMGRANAALIEYHDVPVLRSIEHLTWAPRRKIDRNGYTAALGQAEIRRWAGAGPGPAAPPTKPIPTHQEADDMTPEQLLEHQVVLTSQQQVNAMNANLKATDKPFVIGSKVTLGRILLWDGPGGQRTYALVRQLVAQSTAQARTIATLAAAVQALAANSPAGVRQAMDEGIARLRAELADVDVRVTLSTDDDPGDQVHDEAPAGAAVRR